MEINANSEEDVRRLAQAFLDTPDEDIWKAVAKVYSLGLYRFRGLMVPIMKLVKVIKGDSYLFAFFKAMQDHFPKHLKEDYLYEIIRHIVLGNDKIDEDSVGGWSQEEINKLLATVKFASLR